MKNKRYISAALGFTVIVALIISLVFLSLDQLKSLGGLPLLAFFFSKALFRELGPVLAGIVMAVRIGSQVTVQISSVPMQDRVIHGKG